MRQGRKFQLLGKYRGLDTVQVAERIIAFPDKHSPDAIAVDGDGLGAGVASAAPTGNRCTAAFCKLPRVVPLEYFAATSARYRIHDEPQGVVLQVMTSSRFSRMTSSKKIRPLTVRSST